MRFLKGLLLLLLLFLAAYGFWPRTPSLSGFRPDRMAELQVGLWKAASEKTRYELVLLLYHIFEGEYHVPPAASLKMAFDSATALHIFYHAPDAADQEGALPSLESVFTQLKDETHAPFDPHLAARMELAIWALRTEPSRQADLITAWSEFLGLLYGCPSREAEPAAKNFTSASLLARAGKWPNAQKTAQDAWQRVQHLEKNSLHPK